MTKYGHYALLWVKYSYIWENFQWIRSSTLNVGINFVVPQPRLKKLTSLSFLTLFLQFIDSKFFVWSEGGTQQSKWITSNTNSAIETNCSIPPVQHIVRQGWLVKWNDYTTLNTSNLIDFIKSYSVRLSTRLGCSIPCSAVNCLSF